MLSLKERQTVLATLRYFTMVHQFPAPVDVQGWTVRPGTGKKWKDWLSQGWFALFCLHGLYKILTLAQVFIFFVDTPLYQIILHAMLAAASMTFAFWYYIRYIEYLNDFASFVRITLTGNITGGMNSK